MSEQIERWLAGPVEGIPSLLQPVAHALIQATKEIKTMMEDFPEEMLFERPAGLASVSFHLKHIRGVIDRLFTYASDQPLTAEQLTYQQSEAESVGTVSELVQNIEFEVANALEALKEVDEAQLAQFRAVGRKKFPSTLIGVLVHAAEHTMRHTGQLLVTSTILKSQHASSTEIP